MEFLYLLPFIILSSGQTERLPVVYLSVKEYNLILSVTIIYVEEREDAQCLIKSDQESYS